MSAHPIIIWFVVVSAEGAVAICHDTCPNTIERTRSPAITRKFACQLQELKVGFASLKLPTNIYVFAFCLDRLESSVIHSLAPSIKRVRAWGKVGCARKLRNVSWAMRV